MLHRTLTFAPRSAEEAAEIFRACGAASAAGRSIKAAIVESPFRPGGDAAAEGRAPRAGAPGESSSPREIESLGGSDEVLVLLSHASMNEIHEVSRSDFLAVAGGGTRFGALIEAVRKAGLYFPHEPDDTMREATIAGMIMGGASFRTERRFGRLREYILSLELVTPGGEIIRTGSRSVKDVTGYDLTGLLMGGGGRCGMIVKATIRLLPAPGTRLGFICAGGRDSLESLAGEIRKKLNPAFLEMSPADEGGAAGDGSPAKAHLIGELQSAASGREEALLGSVSGLAPEGVRVSKLEVAALAETGAPGGKPQPARTRRNEPAAEGKRVVEELERRLFRVFDPRGIMLP